MNESLFKCTLLSIIINVLGLQMCFSQRMCKVDLFVSQGGPGSPSFNLVGCPNGRTIEWNCGTEDEKNCNRVQKEDDFHFVVELIASSVKYLEIWLYNMRIWRHLYLHLYAKTFRPRFPQR